MADDKEYSLPEHLRGHSMEGKYEYEHVDAETGLECPLLVGNFLVKTSVGTFRHPAWLAPEKDPYAILEEVTMDEGDILLASAVKTGNHVCERILRMLISGEAKHLSQPFHWMDIIPYDVIQENNKDKRRVIKTHTQLGDLPKTFRRPDTKVIATMRNMKDVFVSFYHHFMGTDWSNGRKQSRPWEEWFKYQLYAKTVMWGSIFDWYADIWDNHRNNPNVLIVFYEDIVMKPEKTISMMSEHIGLTRSPEFIAEVADAVQFDNMKKAIASDKYEIRDDYGPNFSFCRKGQIGDWKNYFTVTQNEEFHKVFDEWNKQRNVPFIHEDIRQSKKTE